MERLLNVELTSFCKADCSMCPRDKVEDVGFISLDTIDKLIKKVEDYVLFEISLSGRGEPTFHPRLLEILEKLKALKTKISIVTTTDGMNEKNYKAILDSADLLRISVSSINEYVFHKIHRNLDYKKIWSNIDKITDYKPEKLHIHLVGGEDTYEGLEDTIKYFKNKNVNNIYLFPLWNRGGNIEEQDIVQKRKYLVDKYDIYYSEDEYLPENQTSLLDASNYCPIGDKSISVNFKGEMMGCFQDFANLTKVCTVNDDIDFIGNRGKVLKKMPVCRECNSSTMARR